MADLIGSLQEALGDGYPYDDWRAQAGKYADYREYYTGDVFDELVEPQDPESPYKYPLKYNMARVFARKHASFLWGQWSKDIVRFTVGPAGSEEAGELQERLMALWRRSRMNRVLLAAAVDQKIDGGVYFKIRWDGKKTLVERVRAEIVFPLWHPQDVDQLAEVAIAYEIPSAVARKLYGYEPRPVSVRDIWGRVLGNEKPPPTVVFIEHWTNIEWRILIEGSVIRQEANPYGFLPFVYIPHFRSGGQFYGDSVVGDIMGLQDEVNMRAADMGERLSYTSHPIRWIKNYQGNVDELPFGPDEVWDLGFTQRDRDPEAGTLDSPGEPASSLQFLDMLSRFAEDSGHAPAVSFGRDEGSQRSGTTLDIRFIHLTQEVMASRVLWSDESRELNMRLLAVDDFHARGLHALRRKASLEEKFIFDTDFWPILPRGRQGLVDEHLALVAGNLEAPETAMTGLGIPDPAAEMERIQTWMQWLQQNQIATQKSFSTRRVE